MPRIWCPVHFGAYLGGLWGANNVDIGCFWVALVQILGISCLHCEGILMMEILYKH